MKKTAVILAVLFLSVGLNRIFAGPLPAEPAAAGQKDVLLSPQTTTEFIGYDIGTARLFRVQFNLDNKGAVIGLALSGRTASRL